MLAVLSRDRLVVYRRVGQRLVLWRSLEGDTQSLARALAAAQRVSALAAASGGWHALGFGKDAMKPVPPIAKPRRLRLYRPDSQL